MRAGDRTVRIGTLHAISGGIGRPDVEQLANNLHSADTPIIIRGDFNFDIGSGTAHGQALNVTFQVGSIGAYI